MKYIQLIFILIFVVFFIDIQAQNKSSVSVRAQATIIDKSEIELITIRNLTLDMSIAKNGIIYVSAKTDANAALMMVKGKPDALFRVTFAPIVEIRNSTGTGTLISHYEMYGYRSDNQNASEPIDAAQRSLKISSEGQFFIWVGSKIDISNARPGSYDGEFTIEIEYI